MRKYGKLALVAMLALLLVAALALVACNDTPQPTDGGSEHQHAFSPLWSSDETHHWHATTCGHDAVSERSMHNFGDDDICDVCNYNRSPNKPKIYSATFIADNKLVMVVNFYEGDTSIVAPEVPQKDHYTAAWEDYTLANQNLSIYAVYTPIEYTVTFVDGFKQTPVQYNVENMQQLVPPQVTPKQYYNGSWQQYQFDFSDDQVIHAEYIPIEYKVTFVGNGHQEIRTYTVETKDQLSAPEVPTRNHYTGVWQEYELQFEENQVVNAVYTPIEYKITFVGNGQRIERTYNAETTSQFVAPEVPAKEEKYYDFGYVGKWERFSFEFDNEQVVNAVYSLDTPGYTYTLNGDQQSYSLTKVSTEISTAIVLPYYNDLPVTSIGERAFFDCDRLKNLTFADGIQLQDIGSSAFYYCSNLTNVYYGGTIESWCGIEFGNGTSNPMSPASLFFMKQGEDWQEVTEIVIPEGVEKIGECQFYGFENITSITIPSTVTSIGDYAFDGCSRLKNLTFEDGIQLQNIGYDAFDYCSNLTNVYYGGTIESWCRIEFGSNYSNPMDNASHFFMKQSGDWQEVTEIVIPESVEKFGDYQFYGFNNIISITIPSTVTSIGKYAFSGCTSLQTITFEDDSQLQSIGSYAFRSCGNLTEIIIPSTVTNIGEYAFYDCSRLKNLTFEDGIQLQNIGYYAFDCDNLTNVYYGGTIENWCGIEFGNGTSNPMCYASHFFMKQSGDWQEVTGIVIPENVEKIGDDQFFGFNNITSITIPSTVTSIGKYAFSGCTSLQTITFEDNSQLQSIGDYAFNDCSSLTEITIPSTVTNIGKLAFCYCSNLTIYCEASSQPSGWGYWNPDNRPVEWGYKQQ